MSISIQEDEHGYKEITFQVPHDAIDTWDPKDGFRATAIKDIQNSDVIVIYIEPCMHKYITIETMTSIMDKISNVCGGARVIILPSWVKVRTEAKEMLKEQLQHIIDSL